MEARPVTVLPDPRGGCHVCDQPKDEPNAWSDHQQRFSIRDLRDGAGSGCETCTLRLNAALCYKSYPDKIAIFQPTRQGFFFFDRGIRFEIFHVENGSNTRSYPNLRKRHLLSEATSSSETFNKLQMWLEECITQHHDTCSHGETATSTTESLQSHRNFMPKRVIDVRFGKVRLVEDPTPQPYVCLSHCWGKEDVAKKQVRTLSTNIDDFNLDIPESLLTLNFREAADVSRRLGIDYIWIDSLCIIQDSDSDWSTQSLQMGDIYEHGVLTIAASASIDGTGGLYRTREPDFLATRPIHGDSVFVRRQIPSFLPDNPFPMMRREVDFGKGLWPLLDRGWVFQEMSLSPRVVHFGRHEVIWQCRKGRRSESGSNDVADWSKTTVYGYMLSSSSGLPSERRWYDIVEAYSGLSLTFMKDKLPALSAMAQRVAETRPPGTRFLAGLWQDTLVEDLLWEVCKPKSSARPTPQAQAQRTLPSWSWASVNSRVEWAARTNATETRKLRDVVVFEPDLEPIGSPFLGKYKQTELVVKGHLLEFTLRTLRQNEKHDNLGENDVFDATAGGGDGKEKDGATFGVSEFNEDYGYSDDSGDVEDADAAAVAYVLPLVTIQTGTMQTGHLCSVFGLALKAVSQPQPQLPTNSPPNRFRRLGFVRLRESNPRYRVSTVDSINHHLKRYSMHEVVIV